MKLISSNLCSLSLCRSTEPKQRQAVLGWLGQSRHGEMRRYRRLPPTHKVRTMPIRMNARVTNLQCYRMFPSHYVGGFRTGRNTTKQSQIRSQVQRSPLLTRGDFAPRSNYFRALREMPSTTPCQVASGATTDMHANLIVKDVS